MIIEYLNMIFDFDVFVCNDCEGEPLFCVIFAIENMG